MARQFDPCKGPKFDAKNLLKAVKGGDHEACERARRHRRDMAGATDQEVGQRFTLLMARHTIAKELGFGSWPELEANPPKAEKASTASSPPVARPLSGPFAKQSAELLSYPGTATPKLESTSDKLRSMSAMAAIKGRAWEADVLKQGAAMLESKVVAENPPKAPAVVTSETRIIKVDIRDVPVPIPREEDADLDTPDLGILGGGLFERTPYANELMRAGEAPWEARYRAAEKYRPLEESSSMPASRPEISRRR